MTEKLAQMKKQNKARDEFSDKILTNHKAIEELNELSKLEITKYMVILP